MDDDDPIGSIIAAGCIGVLVLWVVGGLITAWIIEWVWNALIPPILHWPSINYPQAWVLYVVASIIGAIVRS